MLFSRIKQGGHPYEESPASTLSCCQDTWFEILARTPGMLAILQGRHDAEAALRGAQADLA